MYLKEIYLENTGPISKCHVELPFNKDGEPRPVIIVGPNGSGKTIFLSYIVDALTEFAKKAFIDIVPIDDLGSKPYFRTIQPTAVRSGQSFSLSLLRFKANNEDLYYCEKSGVLEAASYSPSIKSIFTPVWEWPLEGNYKDVLVNQKAVEAEMQNGAYAFFPASRSEYPDWLNLKGIKAHLTSSSTSSGPTLQDQVFKAHLTSSSPRFDKQLNKPLWIETCTEKNISWVLDVFLDSLLDPEEQQKFKNSLDALQKQSKRQQIAMQQKLSYMTNNFLDRHAFGKTRKNVERILGEILQDQTAKLKLNFRNIAPSRISIKMADGREIPTLHSLSAGQSQLFNLFATIIRYGEHIDLNKSVDISQITGLVIIDEIDAHLHPTLQQEVLPQLISLFPKVQFILSSHSPLFLLGMEKTFGEDKVTILELPSGNRINSERYTEFGKAFEYYQSTKRFEADIKRRIADATKPTVFTEGWTDASYIQTALKLHGETELLNSLDIKPVGKKGGNGDKGGGKNGLDAFCKIYEVHQSSFKHAVLLLYDCDTQKQSKEIGRLWVRSIEKNTESTKVKKGIENLFPQELFTDCFYPKHPKADGGHHADLNKPKFCNWICENGRKDDFKNFDKVIQTLKEFLKANQSPTDEQPPQ